MAKTSASKSDEPYISPSLTKQIDSFIDSLERYNAKRPRPRRKNDYDYLRRFYKDYVKDRNQRADEVQSEAYNKVVSFAGSLFPIRPMFNLCIDGRVLAVLAFGTSAIICSGLRVPGGMLRDFIRGKDGKLQLKKDSMYARLLLKVFKKYNTDYIAEVFDSHIGCAARLSEEQVKGRLPEDSGLMADVSHKRQITSAVTQFVQEEFGDTKKILPIQTAFDPHTGYIYMGLEVDGVFDHARRTKGGFTDDMLSELVQKKKIISTQHLEQNETIQNAFQDHYFPIDWRENYVESAEKFWHAIASLKKTVFPILEPILLQIYPHLKKTDTFSQKEKEERLLLLLSNTFSGYLHNHLREHRKSKKKSESETHLHYPYGIHQEEGISVGEEGYPPNHLSMFAVFGLDEKNLSQNIDLAAGLVRKNRLENRVSDRYSTFKNEQEFAEASVPIVVREIIRERLGNHWDELEKISWNDLPNNWEQMSDMDFIEYLQSKGNLPMSMVLGINNLRKRMALLFDPTISTSSHLVEHYKVALPIIAGRFRKNHFVVPFVKLGFV